MKSNMRKVFLVVISLFFLTYVGYQGYQFIYSPYDTEIALEYDMQKTIPLEGIVIRDEHVLNEEAVGVIQYSHNNGDKVAGGTVIAYRYDNPEDIAVKSKIEVLEKQIELLKKSQDPGSNYKTDLDTVLAQLDSVYADFMKSIQTQADTNINGYKNDILLYLNKRQILTGQATDFNALIAELEQERNTLNSSLQSQPAAIVSDSSGYFTNEVDGLESEYSIERIQDMTEDDLAGMLEKDKETLASSSIGKIITGNEWKYVAFIASEDVKSLIQTGSFSTGSLLNVKFDSGNSVAIPLKIETLREKEIDGKQMVVFTSDIMNSDVSALRQETAKIVMEKISGLKVNKNALHIVKNNKGNDQKGVYVVSGKKMLFKQVEILAEEDDYFISKIDELNSNALQIYDEVIIKGKDLYDKKPI